MPHPSLLLVAAALQSVTGRMPPSGSWEMQVMAGASAEPVIWQSRPGRAEVVARFPPEFSGQGYTHVQCRISASTAALSDCTTAPTGFKPPSPFAPYPEIDALGLSVAKELRLDPAFARRHPLKPIYIVFQFSARDNSPLVRGFCLPFCSPHF